MFKSMLGFITGVILLYFSGDLINSSTFSLKYYIVFIIALSCTCLPFLAYAYIKNIHFLFHVTTIFLFLVIGFCYALISAEAIKAAQLTSKHDNQAVLLTGFLCSLPREGEYSFSAVFCLIGEHSDIESEMLSDGYKAKLRWPLGMKVPDGLNTFEVAVRQPKSTVNFIGTPYETRSFYERIVLIGNIESVIETRAIDQLNYAARLRYYYHQARKSVKSYSDSLLDGSTHQGVIQALLMGDKAHLTGEHFKVLANTGTQHLIAISGLHVGLVMFGLYWFFPKKKVSLFVVSILGIFYVLLVGFSPSAQRAWVMCLCALLFLSGYINIGKWRIYICALFLVLLLDPLSTLSLGFWYSFLCVAILFLLSQTLSITSRPVFSFMCLQLLLLVGMIPISSLLGTKHGVENILANSLAIPWVSLLVLPLTLLWFAISLLSESSASYALNILNSSIELMMSYLSSLRIIDIPLSMDTHWLTILAFTISFVILLVFQKVKAISITSLLGIVLTIAFPGQLANTNTEFIVFDVGQGLALGIKSGDNIWLYDTGPAFSKLSSSEKVILPYLRRHQKTNAFFGLIVSHGDADHAGDIKSLYDYAVPSISWTSQPERLDISGFTLCQKGMSWQSEALKVETLYPFSNTDLSELSSNNHSCVVRITLMGKIFLLMGDLEGQAELDLVSYYRNELKADVLIAGHHGAAKSNSFALLKHVKPEYIVFSAGYMNRFGHPSESVMERIKSFYSLGNKKSPDPYIFNTADYGALRFNMSRGEGQLKIDSARVVHSKIWVKSE